MIRFLNTLRSWFLSPDSNLELGLRTLYHKILATRIAFLIQDWFAQRSFQKWRKKSINFQCKSLQGKGDAPKVAFIILCREGFTSIAQSTIFSINNLVGLPKEIFLFVPENISYPGDQGKGVKESHNHPVETKIEDLLNKVEGDYVIFCEAGDQFYSTLLHQFSRCIQDNPSVAIATYDCEYPDPSTGQLLPHFKPQKLSPDLLLSVNYMSRSFFRRDSIRQFIGKEDLPDDFFAIEYFLVLRVTEKSPLIVHIPAMLARMTGLVRPVSNSLRDVVSSHLRRIGLKDVGYEKRYDAPRFFWQSGNPSVAIVILTKNHHQLLKSLLESIRTHTKSSNFEIVIVDNGSDHQSTKNLFETHSDENKIEHIPYNRPFNYSEAINLGAQSSESDLILFLNDDMLVCSDDWLDELTQWVIRPEIGVVGAKLLRQNHTIQHAGIIMGLNGFAGHLYLNAPEHYQGLFGSADWYRNLLAVTGACQMVRREVFMEVGGYDEAYTLAFGDIDFCLRVHNSGYRNLLTPFADIHHFEGQSRGYTTPTSDILKGLEEMEQYLIDGDPFYSPHLTLTRIPKCDLSPSTKISRKKQIDSRTSFYTRLQ